MRYLSAALDRAAARARAQREAREDQRARDAARVQLVDNLADLCGQRMDNAHDIGHDVDLDQCLGYIAVSFAHDGGEFLIECMQSYFLPDDDEATESWSLCPLFVNWANDDGGGVQQVLDALPDVRVACGGAQLDAAAAHASPVLALLNGCPDCQGFTLTKDGVESCIGHTLSRSGTENLCGWSVSPPRP